MWQRFTERARRVVFFAQEEVSRLGENYVSTEHILLGLIREDDNVACRILERIGISSERVRQEIDRQVTRGDGRLSQDIQLTPRAKRVIDFAYDEARAIGNDYIGTEHLLLGLIREGEGMAGRALTRLGATLEAVRNELLRFLDMDPKPQAESVTRTGLVSRAASAPTIGAGLVAAEAVRHSGPLWHGRSLVSLADVSPAAILAALTTASAMKTAHRMRSPVVRWRYPRTLGMIFEKPSLRTRVSFEAAMAHLGGHAINLQQQDIGLGTREPVSDVAMALSRWVDIISARVFKHETVEELARYATVPVINALSDREHPIQAFADLLTLHEQKGVLGNDLKLAYVGAGNNVLHALLLACAKMGVNLSAACPEGYFPDPEYVQLAQQAAVETGATIVITTDPSEAVADADALYTDVWTSMGQESEHAARLEVFAPYRIDTAMVSKAKADAIVLHCLPAHTGEEISAEVYEAHRTVIMDQAENRMHTQKALIALMVGIANQSQEGTQ